VDDDILDVNVERFAVGDDALDVSKDLSRARRR
jgi:hypothetical protein